MFLQILNVFLISDYMKLDGSRKLTAASVGISVKIFETQKIILKQSLCQNYFADVTCDTGEDVTVHGGDSDIYPGGDHFLTGPL